MFEQNRDIILYVETRLIYLGDFGFNLYVSAKEILFTLKQRRGLSSLKVLIFPVWVCDFVCILCGCLELSQASSPSAS